MTDLPIDAVTAATEAVAAELPKLFHPWLRATQSQEHIRASAFDAAVRALEAAAPHLTAAATAAERDRIIALIEAEEGKLRAAAEDEGADVLSYLADLLTEGDTT